MRMTFTVAALFAAEEEEEEEDKPWAGNSCREMSLLLVSRWKNTLFS